MARTKNASTDEQVVWSLTRAGLEEIVGRPLTDQEVAVVAKTIGHSSIGEVVADAIDACGLSDDGE